MANTQLILDYIHQLKRHTEGRVAVLLRLSILERPFHESFYRQSTAKHMKALLQKYEGEYYILPNKDGLLIIKDCAIDVIDTAIATIRKIFHDSTIIKDLDPVQGQTDVFAKWFRLEDDYDDFIGKITVLINQKATDVEFVIDHRNECEKSEHQQDHQGHSLSIAHKFVPISTPNIPTTSKQKNALDPENLLSLSRAIENADLETFVVKEKVVAVVAQQDPVPVMQHYHVPFEKLIETLMPTLDCKSDDYLKAYLMKIVDKRLLINKPDMSAAGILLSSIRLAVESIFSPAFKNFEAANHKVSKKNIMIEFDLLASLQNTGQLQATLTYLTQQGYRTCLSGIAPRAFHWLKLDDIPVDFYKIYCSGSDFEAFEDDAFIAKTKDSLKGVELGKVILTGCHSEHFMDFGQKCGITIMQGQLFKNAL